MNESQTQIKFTYHHMNSACSGTKYSSTWIKGVPSFFNGCFLLNRWQSQKIHTYRFVPTGLHALPTPNDDIFDEFIVTLVHTSICMYPSHFICCFLALISINRALVLLCSGVLLNPHIQMSTHVLFFMPLHPKTNSVNQHCLDGCLEIGWLKGISWLINSGRGVLSCGRISLCSYIHFRGRLEEPINHFIQFKPDISSWVVQVVPSHLGRRRRRRIRIYYDILGFHNP